MAASAALAGTAGCKASDKDVIVPYSKKPADVIPGIANYYASTYQEGLSAYGVLVKAREGRPIHIDGNDEHPIFKGKTSLRTQAEILGLYDPQRLRHPRISGRQSSWDEVENLILTSLRKSAKNKQPVLLLTPAVISPTRRSVIADLRKTLPGLKHVEWEPARGLSERKAAEALYGSFAVPRYRMERAKVLASFEADFLGSMEGAVEAAAGFAFNRKPATPKHLMSRFYAFESRLSLTGAKADARIRIKPSAAAQIAFAIAWALHHRHGMGLPGKLGSEVLRPFNLDAIARRHGLDWAVLSALTADLARVGRESLVLAGPALPPEAHAAVALINFMTGAEGHSVDTSHSVDAPPLAEPLDMARLSRELARGAYGAAIFCETNPSYGFVNADEFNHDLAKTPMKIFLGLQEDETARRCDVILPINHWLESWNDFETSTDLLSLQQPLVQPLYDTRQTEEILLDWAKELTESSEIETEPRQYLMARWRKEVYPAGTPASFDQFWTAAVCDGILRRQAVSRPLRRMRPEALKDAARSAASAEASTGLELLLEPDLKVWDGRYANIGWLQELPDPVSKVCWGNYLAISPEDSKKFGVSDGDSVSVADGTQNAVLPILVQPGQAEGTAFAALGYGRKGDVAEGIGTNMFPLVADDGPAPFLRLGVSISRAAGRQPLVRSQKEFSTQGRGDIVRLWSMDEYRRNAKPPKDEKELATLYGNPEWPEHKWGMAVDLSACVGCATCQISCQSENNIPVVGPEQVSRGRIMHWVRSDVYYVGPKENPELAHSLIMCQQCDDAPCEPVCPVSASVHSSDGLNEQVYNRCIGVRYCLANCPYIARRFNFFDYTSSIKDPLALAFNPEVTVRPRGVAEKCTFCVQRIRNGTQIAKDQNRPLRDGEIVPACAVACPADAIVFGDLKDPESRISKLSRSDRGFKVLEEVGTRPAVTYLAELKNPPKEVRRV